MKYKKSAHVPRVSPWNLRNAELSSPPPLLSFILITLKTWEISRFFVIAPIYLMMYPLHLLKTRFFFPFCIWFIHFLWNLFCLFFLVVAGVGEDDSRRPGGGPRSQQQQQAQMNQTLHSELALSKEQLYDLFQQILGVKKFEHQLLFNALQVRIYVDYTIFIINICYEKEFVDGKWLLNDRHKKFFVKTIFFFRLAAGFVGRTSRRHPKRTRRSTAKSGGNGKGSFFFFSSLAS